MRGLQERRIQAHHAEELFGVTDSLVELGLPGSGAVRFLDRDQGVLVTVQSGTDIFPSTLKRARGFQRFSRVKQPDIRQARALIIDTKDAAEPELPRSLRDVDGVLIELTDAGGKKSFRAINVKRNTASFPNFSLLPPSMTHSDSENGDIYSQIQILRRLKPEDLVVDLQSTRTQAEVDQDHELALEFVDWLIVGDKISTVSPDIEVDAPIRTPGSIDWINEKGNLTFLSFIPDKCILLKQELVEECWEVTEYMVDINDEKLRIYKSTLPRQTGNIVFEGMRTVNIPPYIVGRRPEANITQRNAIERDRNILLVIRGENRVPREEFDQLKRITAEILSTNDPRKD